MSEYTSHDVTTRLIAAGFAEPPDTRTVDVDVLPWRSDTLMNWLLAHNTPVYIDKKNKTYYVYSYADGDVSITQSVTAPTLPDALAEVVMQAMEVSK